MRIAFGTDEQTSVTDTIRDHLTDAGHEVVMVAGDKQVDGIVGVAPWPLVGRSVGESVATGDVDMGVVCCWTGTGVSIASNKVSGARAALCTDAETARGARRWNDANVLAIGLRLTTSTVAVEMLDAFLETAPDPDEHALIADLEPGIDRPGRFSS